MDEGLHLPSSSSSTSFTTNTTTTALEEEWRLVDKYYADHTFNDQDWDAARVNYYTQNNNNHDNMDNNATSMRAANEMIKFLGDKYIRILDQDSYAAIQ